MHRLNTKALYVIRLKGGAGTYDAKMCAQAPTTAELNRFQKWGRALENFEVVRYEIVERETVSAEEYLKARGGK